jgi:hypothetical protein
VPGVSGQRSPAPGRWSGAAVSSADRSARGLAGRAPPHRALLALRSELADLDRGAAAQAGPAAAIDPEPASGSAVAGGDPVGPVAVGNEEGVGASHHPRQAGNLRHGGVRVDAGDEAELGALDFADAGEVALVEQRFADGYVGRGREPAYRLLGVPVGAEEVGAEVTDQVAFR